MSYTKGPWGIEQTETNNWIGPLRPNGKVAILVTDTERGDGLLPDVSALNDANARLIAAAPDLLTALEAIELEGLIPDGFAILKQQVSAAIYKATGGET